jgi:hypothetical protein
MVVAASRPAIMGGPDCAKGMARRCVFSGDFEVSSRSNTDYLLLRACQVWRTLGPALRPVKPESSALP